MLGSRYFRLLAMFAVGAAFVPSALADDAAPSTFSRDIAPIFQRACQECHRPGEIAPMSLLTYEETRPWAKSIKKEVAARRMPPWHADSKPGQFENDMSLSESEIAAISRWVDSGAPEGDPKDLPAPKKFEKKEWELGTPDLILMPDKPFLVPPTKPDQDLYQCLILPTNIQEDAYVQAFAYKVSNRKIVHHIVAFADATGRAAKRDAETPEPGFPCGMGLTNGIGSVANIDMMLGGWGPGVPPNVSRPGTAKLLPKNAVIIMQMHYYNQTEREQEDLSGVGIYFAKETVQARARIMPIIAPPGKFLVPAGQADALNRGTWNVSKDVYVYSMAPHMHTLGKAMTLTALYPDGQTEVLLSAPRFDFNWQLTYHLAEPKLLPKGTKVEMLSVHDNSAENPRNTHTPPIDVKWGESTSEEMSIGFVGYAFADEKLGIAPKGR